jgi:hypothetical protein
MRKHLNVRSALSIPAVYLLVVFSSGYDARAQSADLGPQGEKVMALREELTKISADIDAGVEDILDLIIPLTDSTDTGNKVTQLKQESMMALRKTIDYYATERQKLDGELARTASGMTKEQMATQVEVIDEKIDQRVNEILRISASLAENQDVEKYEHTYDPYSEIYNRRVTDEYKQNQKVQRRVVDSRDKLTESLQKSITTLKERVNRYERLLPYQTSESNKVAINQLIEETKARISDRETQLQTLGSSYGQSTGSNAIGDDEFKVVVKMITEKKAEIRSSLDLMRRVKSEYDNALIRYNNARRLQNF